MCTIDGYNAETMTDNWAAKYYGPQAVSGLGEPPHNCTLFVAWMLARHGLRDPGRSWGDAYQWGDTLRAYLSRTPTVGSVAWYALGRLGGGDGHVAWVARVNRRAHEVFLVSDNYGGSVVGSTSSGWTPFGAPSGYIDLQRLERPRHGSTVTRAMVARVRAATPGA
ncbi:MAG TPA: CHAP domain-containing protein [Acidimicrobiales bacterium]|nr:CHAP domain-containing protein [Acidimicrobiales bacterium]